MRVVDYRPRLLKVVKFNRNLQKMMIVALKDKKSSHDDTKDQTIAIELYKEPETKTKKGHIRLVIVLIGVDVVAKIVDEFYILIKIYSYLSFAFCCVKEDRVAENIKSDVDTLRILR